MDDILGQIESFPHSEQAKGTLRAARENIAKGNHKKAARGLMALAEIEAARNGFNRRFVAAVGLYGALLATLAAEDIDLDGPTIGQTAADVSNIMID